MAAAPTKRRLAEPGTRWGPPASAGEAGGARGEGAARWGREAGAVRGSEPEGGRGPSHAPKEFHQRRLRNCCGAVPPAGRSSEQAGGRQPAAPTPLPGQSRTVSAAHIRRPCGRWRRAAPEPPASPGGAAASAALSAAPPAPAPPPLTPPAPASSEPGSGPLEGRPASTRGSKASSPRAPPPPPSRPLWPLRGVRAKLGGRPRYSGRQLSLSVQPLRAGTAPGLARAPAPRAAPAHRAAASRRARRRRRQPRSARAAATAGR
jgi:hypothetical protein